MATRLLKLTGQQNDDRLDLLNVAWAVFKTARTDKRPTYAPKSNSTINVQLNGKQFTNFISQIYFVNDIIYLTNIFCILGLSDEYITLSNTHRHKIAVYVQTHYKANPKKPRASRSENLDEYLNIVDDFKTNLLWLSIFIRTVEGVSMRIPVNYRQVLQSNYFKTEEGKGKNMFDAVYEPDGDSFQNSPLKMVFYVTKSGNRGNIRPEHLKLTSISKIDVSPECAKLPEQKDSEMIDYSNKTLQMEHVTCIWPRQEDLRDLLFFLGFHPYDNLSSTQHSFPWDDILSLFNGQDMTDPKALKHMLAELSLEFIYNDHEDNETNLRTFKEFYQFMTPVSGCPVEGAHRIDLIMRLLYGVTLKEEAPFFTNLNANPKPEEFIPLPSNSTVYKPIHCVVYLQKESSSPLCMNVTKHLLQLSRKIADQKDLYIKDTWRSLFQSIYSALDEDTVFLETLYETQQELYQEVLHQRQQVECKARKNRERLSLILADVIFAENPTSTLATESNADIQKWKQGMQNSTWTGMDSNPFTSVRNVISIFFLRNIFLKYFL
jgi:hypothetical protein